MIESGMFLMVQEYGRRLGLLFGGLLITAAGVVLVLQANVGLEPWSVLHQGLSIAFGITYGNAATIVGAAVIAIAVLFGESFGIGTVANVFVAPVMIDIFLWLDWVPQMQGIIPGIFMLLAGLELIVFGTWMYMQSTLGEGPRDALMVVLNRKTKRSVGLCRSTVELIAILVGWRLGGQVGIGTVISAVGIGTLFNLNFALLRFDAATLHQENLPETLRRMAGKPD